MIERWVDTALSEEDIARWNDKHLPALAEKMLEVLKTNPNKLIIKTFIIGVKESE
jgi:hypothetical protein